jgi:hypothetical protein
MKLSRSSSAVPPQSGRESGVEPYRERLTPTWMGAGYEAQTAILSPTGEGGMLTSGCVQFQQPDIHAAMSEWESDSAEEIARSLASFGQSVPVFDAAQGSGGISLDPTRNWMSSLGVSFEVALALRNEVGSASGDGRMILGTLEQASRDSGATLEIIGAAFREATLALSSQGALLSSPGAQPSLPDLSQVQSLMAAVRQLRAVTQNAAYEEFDPSGALFEGMSGFQDACVAMLQGLTVVGARASWQQGVPEPDVPQGGGDPHGRIRSDPEAGPLNDIFADSGFNTWGIQINDGGAGNRSMVEWCGMFVSAHMFNEAGLAENLRAGFLETRNVEDYFKYGSRNAKRTPRMVWSGSEWQEQRTFHEASGSVRSWISRNELRESIEAGESPNIRPGDVILFDQSAPAGAEHIGMVESYDPTTMTLVTIEGNTRGIQADAQGEPQSMGGDHYRGSTRDGSGLHQRDMSNVSDASRARYSDIQDDKVDTRRQRPAGANRDLPGSTLFGVGRPSICDYEGHVVAAYTVPEEYRHMSPEQLKQIAGNRYGVSG